MKTIKILLSGLLLFGMTSFMCQGQVGVLTSTSTTIGTLTGTDTLTDFLAKFQQYMDATQLSAFIAAYQADQNNTTHMSFSAFCMDYIGKNPTFYASLLEAIDKAKKDAGVDSDEDLTSQLQTKLQQQVEDLKSQLEDLKELSDEQKKKYEDLLDKQKALNDQLAQQLGNANAAVAQAIQAASQKPQEQDPMQQMLPMLMMMMMMMMQGGGGGGGGSQCGSGSCG